MTEKKKGELVELFKKNANNSCGNETKVEIKGNSNQIAGRDINNYVNEKPSRPSVKFSPDPSFHIQPPIVGKIQRLIYKLADIEATAGNGEIGNLRRSWWSRLNNHFGVGTYREIPASKGGQAVSWLQQHVAINRPKLRRPAKISWRNEHYKAIWARSREIGLAKADVYDLAEKKFGAKIISLKQLSDANLKKLYSSIMAK